MSSTDHDRRTVSRRARELRRSVGAQVRTLREDAGLTQAALARAAGISRSHQCQIEVGSREASDLVLVKLADVLGADVSIRLQPGTGPRLRDHIQARIIDALLVGLHERWHRFLEVPVYRPARGVIDIVLHEPEGRQLVVTEVQSELRRLEQLLRWSNLKRDAIRSAELWPFVAADATPTVSGLLVARSTAATRAVVRDHGALLAAAYPARAAEIHAALTGTAAWPGSGVLWVSVDRNRARILDGPPRGIALGR